MNKNTLIGFILMGAVLFLFSWYNQSNLEKSQKVKTEKVQSEIEQAIQENVQSKDSLIQDSVTNDNTNLAIDTDSLRKIQLNEKFGAFINGAEGEKTSVTLENDSLLITLSSMGGRIDEAKLKLYKTYDSLPVILFTGTENDYGFTFTTRNNHIIHTSDLYFEPIKSKDGKSVTMHLDLNNGNYFDIIYTLLPNYMVKMDIAQKGLDAILQPGSNAYDIYWNQTLRRQEKGRIFEERNSGLFYKFAVDDVEYLSESKSDSKNITNELKWIGYKNQFFSTALISDVNFKSASLSSKVIDKSPKYLKEFKTATSVENDFSKNDLSGFRFYLGPNSYPLLSTFNDHEELDLDKLVPLGASVFRIVNTWVVIPLFTFFGKFIGNYGIIILLLTIVIKIIISPLTYKSYMSSAKMRVLRPQIEEINARYPGQDKAMDRQKATMDLYNKAGINPMSGCLPMLLQMPILFAMFTFFPSSIELRQESFLWAKDLSSYDAIFSWNTHIPIISDYFGNHISLFCLLMTITNILYTKINMNMTNTGQQMPGMKLMMYMMPLMFLFIFNNYASGLSYYYFISTLITILQTLLFYKFVNEKKLLAKLEENKKKPRKKSGFMARLEEAQRKQQEALKQQQKQRGKR